MLQIAISNTAIAHIPGGAILNLRDLGTSKGSDPSTNTAPRKVVIPQFGDSTVKLCFSEFPDMNPDPEGHGLVTLRRREIDV